MAWVDEVDTVPVIGHRDRPELPEPDGGLGGRFEGGMDKRIHAEFADGSPDCRVGNPVHAEPDGGLGINGRPYHPEFDSVFGG